MKKRMRRLIATLLAATMIVQQGGALGVHAGETEPMSEKLTEAAVISQESETEIRETEASETQAEETEAVETQAPATEQEVTEAPETQAPATEQEITEAPETQAPAAEQEATEAPETQAEETKPSEAQTEAVPAETEAATEAETAEPATEQATESEAVTEAATETEPATEQLTEAGPTLLKAECDGVTVKVEAGEGVLKAGTVLKMEPAAGKRVALEAIQSVLDEGTEVNKKKFLVYDITLMLDGQEVQPDGEVTVSFSNVPFKAEKNEELIVAHLNEEEASPIGTISTFSATPGVSGVEMEKGLSIKAKHFSVYAIGVLRKYYEDQSESGNTEEAEKYKEHKDDTIIEGKYQQQNSFSWTDSDGNTYGSAAFDFHIFANEVEFTNHTNGNIATDKLNAHGHAFGTNQNKTGGYEVKDENGNVIQTGQGDGVLEYNYFGGTVENMSGTVASGATVLGPDTEYTVGDDDSITVGGGKHDGNQFYEEQRDGTDEKFLDIKKELENLSKMSAALGKVKTSSGIEITAGRLDYGQTESNDPATIDLSDQPEGGVYYLNVTANELLCKMKSGQPTINIKGAKNRTLIISVDMSNLTSAEIEKFKTLRTTIDEFTNGEDVVRSNCNVMWNFYQKNGDQTETFTTSGKEQFKDDGYFHLADGNGFLGTVLAPGADVWYGAVNGSIIANKAHSNGNESHNWRFTGLSASITVKKILDDPGSTETKTFTFGIFDENGVRVPDQRLRSVTVKAGESASVTFSNLQPGKTYYVYEVDSNGNPVKNGLTADGYYVSGDGPVMIPEGAKDKEVSITNSKQEKKEGSLAVTKTVSGNMGDTSKEFNFKVELSDKTITGKYGDMEFKDGVATFKLKHGQSATATGLPADINYTVTETEANQDDYVTKADGASGSIKQGETAIASFVNTKQQVGSLEVTKTFAGDNLSEDQKKAITFTVTGPNKYKKTFTYADMTNGKKTLENLMPGAYTVTESNANVDGYNLTMTYSVTDGKVTVSKDMIAKVEVTNDYAQKKGSLKIQKTVENPDKATVPKSFRFTVQDKDGNYYDTSGMSKTQVTVEVEAGKTVEIPNLPIGEYTVTEVKDGVKTPEGFTWKVTVDGDNTNTVKLQVTDSTEKGYQAETASFTNTYKKKDDANFVLKGTKKLINGKTVGALKGGDYSFKIEQISGEKIDSMPKNAENDRAGSFEFDAIKFTKAGTYSFRISEVSGTDSNVIYDEVTTYTVEVKVTGNTEDGFKIGSVTCGEPLTPGADGDYELPKQTDTDVASVEASFINRVKKGSLKIVKNVTVDGKQTSGTEADGTYTFTVTKKDDPNFKKTVTLTIENGVSAEVTLDDLDLGAYIVKEETAGLSRKHISVEGEGEEEVTVVYPAPAEIPTATFTNNRTTGVSITLGAKKIFKAGETELALKGGEFKFSLTEVNENGLEISGGEKQTEVTNKADGVVEFKAIKYVEEGTHYYRIKEKIPTGQDKDGTILYATNSYRVKVTVEEKEGALVATADKEAKDLIFTNTKTKVAIDKTDKDTGAKLAGATLQIVDSTGKVVEGPWLTDGEPHDVTGKLQIGASYQLVELAAPEGYTIAAPVDFSVNDKGEIVVDGEVVATITMQDSVNKVSILKVDETGAALAGAKLQVKDSTGKVVEGPWTTDGKAHEITKLAKGKYTLNELEAPEGYAVSEDAPFEITGEEKADQVIEVGMTDKKTSVKVSKVDVTTSEELEGARIQILDKDGNVVAEWDSAKEAHEVTGLKTGETYTLRETVAPDGYTVTAETTFTLKADGTIDSGKTTTNAKDGVLLVEDSLNKASILKVDETGVALAGAKLEVKNAAGAVVDSWTTDGKAHEITKLAKGSYTLSEIEAPDGYVVSKNVAFEITGKENDGQVIEVEMTDSKTSVKVSKVDVTTSEELAGAHIQILDKDGNVVEEWDSTTEAHEVKGLKTGETYTLKETVAPDGYTVTAETMFTLNADGTIDSGKTTTDAKDGVLLVEDSTNTLRIQKVDESGATLAGAKLLLKNAAGEPVDSWTTDGKAHDITKLAKGKYTLSEIEAPKGYQVSADIPVEITGTELAGQVIEVTMTDKKIPESDNRSLTVTKKLELDGVSSDLMVTEATYYVALFSDADRTQRVSDVKQIVFKDATVSSVTFDNLGMTTYYVGETDANGNRLDSMKVGNRLIFYPEYGANSQFEFKGRKETAVADFTNVYVELPPGFYLSGQITVTKKILLNGEEGTSDGTYYAGVFNSADMNEALAIIPLELNGGSSTSYTLTNLPIGETVDSTATYYVAETDENGNVLDPDKVTEFEISIDKSEVVLDANNSRQEVVITNSFTEEETETETETETEVPKKEAPKTGDDTDFMRYLLLMVLSAGICAVGLEEKRRRARREDK